MLKNLHASILNWHSWIIAHEKEAKNLPFPNRAIIKQYRMVLSTLLSWIEEIELEYRNI
jgi:hypothetical protein